MKRLNDPIDLRPRQSGNIGNLLPDMNRFKVVHESPRLNLKDKHGNEFISDEITLIKQGICPVCLCGLKVSKKGDVYCRSVKHKSITKKSLFISKSGMEKIK